MVADGTYTESNLYFLAEKKPETTEMDIPKITVYKSPPWHKPPSKSNLITPKLSDVYEAFPSKSKVFSKRVTVGMSRSLECIPENNVLQDTHKYSTTHLLDSQRLSPHQVLPPIQRCGEDDLPEMRQRAYSDPHRYSVSKKKTEERRESPLVKSKPLPVPPKEKHDPVNQSHILSQSTHKVQRKSLQKEVLDRKVTFRSPIAMPTSPISEHRQTPPSVIKSSLGHSEDKPGPTLSRRKISSTNPNPSTPERKVLKNKKLTTKNASADAIIAHPSVAALKDCNRIRTYSLPSSLKERRELKKQSNTLQPLRVQDEMKSTVAYALVASPGRNRWPSPERNATSYINTDSSDSATPTDGRQSADSLETIELTSTNKIDQPSEAFKTILRDLKKSSHVHNDLYTITDPQEYFRRVANLEGPA